MSIYHLTESDKRLLQETLNQLRAFRTKQIPNKRPRDQSGGRKGSTNLRHFQLIRGTVTGSVKSKFTESLDLVRYVEIEDITEFEDYAIKPTPEPIRVKLSDDGDDITPSHSDVIWAAYHDNLAQVKNEITDGSIKGVLDDVTIMLDPDKSSEFDNQYNGKTFKITSGEVEGTKATITAYNAENHTVTVDKAFDPLPSVGDAYEIYEILDIDWLKLPSKGGGADVTIVHIDDNITGVEEITDDNGDPIENDDLNLFAYARTIKDLKYYVKAESEELTTGECGTVYVSSITLADTASAIPDFYNDCILRINDEKVTITDYNGTTRVATISPGWTVTPDSGDTYTIYREDPGYDPDKEVMILAYDDQGTESDYITIPIYYDDGKDFKVGEYTRKDYPDYPDTEAFPPDGTGTYQEETDPNFFKKRYRGIAVERVLVTALCQQLPPPKLTEVSS